MFQSFEVTARPEQGPPRLAALREVLEAEALDGFLVPRADAHQGEYVAPHDERLAWLTGFTGSAGFCAALREVAGVFIDGRYRTQVKAQVADVFTPVPWPEVSLGKWLREQLPQGGRVGFDPWLHTPAQIAEVTEALAGTGIHLKPSDNLVDRIWTDQPPPPMAPAKVHPIDFAGEDHATKRARLADGLREAGVDLDHADRYYDHESVPQPGKFYFPVQCQQCDNPPCVKVCPVEATWREADGIIAIDYDWCIGCRYCEAACPYWARRFNFTAPKIPEDQLNPDMAYLGNRPRPKGVVEKCTFCIQRTRKGRYPACVEICPVGARKFGNLLDPNSEIRYLIEHKRVFRLKEDLNTHPKFYYFFAYGR